MINETSGLKHLNYLNLFETFPPKKTQVGYYFNRIFIGMGQSLRCEKSSTSWVLKNLPIKEIFATTIGNQHPPTSNPALTPGKAYQHSVTRAGATLRGSRPLVRRQMSDRNWDGERDGKDTTIKSNIEALTLGAPLRTRAKKTWSPVYHGSSSSFFWRCGMSVCHPKYQDQTFH